jgi:hypothetical protein
MGYTKSRIRGKSNANGASQHILQNTTYVELINAGGRVFWACPKHEYAKTNIFRRMKMKKRVLALTGFISVVMAIGLLLTGCAGEPPPAVTYDTSVPESQLCNLEIAGGLKVIGFNGKQVSWAENGTGPGENKMSSNAWRAQQKGSEWKTTIRIPAGSHVLEANMYLWDYNKMPGAFGDGLLGQSAGYIKASGLEIKHDFQPGQTYFLRPVLIVKGLFQKNESEMIDYNNSGPTGMFQGAYLRIDQNGKPVASGNTVR